MSCIQKLFIFSFIFGWSLIIVFENNVHAVEQQQGKCDNDSTTPICGSNGQVYNNECAMKAHNSSILKSEWERCRGLHPLCPADCLDIQDPVCSEEGKVYPNKCVMHRRNCGKRIAERPIIFCLGSHRKSRTQSKCPEQCLELHQPVCGSDGQIYLNECYLRMMNCNNGVEKMEMKECVQVVSKCPTSCIPIYDPVCNGYNKKVYINKCTMMKTECNKPVRNMPMQFCVGDDVHKL